MSLLKLLPCFFTLFIVFELSAQSDEGFILQIGSPDSSEYASALLVDENSDTYLAMTVFHAINRQQQLKLDKISSDGRILWSKVYPGKNESIFSMIKEADGSLILAGGVQEANGDWPADGSALLIKMDEAGNKIWEKSFKFGDRGSIYEMYKTDDGYLLYGSGYSDRVGISPHSVFLCKTDFHGVTIWEKEFKMEGPDGNFLIKPLQNGDFFCLIENTIASRKYPTLLFTLSPDGTVHKEREIRNAGINSIVELENSELLFFQSEKTKDDTSKNSITVYAKKLQADSLNTFRKLVNNGLWGSPELLSGYFYFSASINGHSMLLKMSQDFQLLDTAVIDLPDGAQSDCFYITDQAEIVLTGILQKPKDPALQTSKSKHNYDIIIEKEKLSKYFKN